MPISFNHFSAAKALFMFSLSCNNLFFRVTVDVADFAHKIFAIRKDRSNCATIESRFFVSDRTASRSFLNHRIHTFVFLSMQTRKCQMQKEDRSNMLILLLRVPVYHQNRAAKFWNRSFLSMEKTFSCYENCFELNLHIVHVLYTTVSVVYGYCTCSFPVHLRICSCANRLIHLNANRSRLIHKNEWNTTGCRALRPNTFIWPQNVSSIWVCGWALELENNWNTIEKL